jgi:D-alanyl-D-alanine carboxypeptidase (penicillin-binding protein 5/6)
MKRYSPFYCFSLFFIAVFFISPSTWAGRIPTLDDRAKFRPGKLLETSSFDHAARPSWVSLGAYSDITTVKKRVGTRASNHHKPWRRLTRIEKKISSKSVMIIDAENGETLYAKSPDSPRQPASTIKVLTGMIAIKSLKNNDTIPVSRRAARMPRSKIYLSPKKHYKADDLINAVLLASANDASVALAEKIAGSEKDFAKMMTLRARLWGASKTICRTATGLTARGQQSTARDLAAIFRHAMQDKEFARRMHKTKVRTSFGQTLRNHNRALWRVKGAEGGKTGYTAAARQTYVGKFTRDGESIIVAIMGSETMWPDIKNLVEYGFQQKKLRAQAREQQTRLASNE